MTKKRITQTRKRHLRIYKKFIALRKASDHPLKTSNTAFYEILAEEEGYDSETIRKMCNKLSREIKE